MWLLIRIVLPSDAQLAEELAQLDPGARIEARGRLVEQQDLRVVDEGVGQAEPLLHAARQRLDVVRRACRPRSTSSSRSPIIRRRAGGRQAVAAGEEVEVLPDLHVVVDTEDVGHEAEDATDLVGVPGDRPAVDLGVAGRRLEQGRQHPQRRRLAGAVRADEAEDLARLDREVDAGDGERPVVALDQALGPDDGAHRTVP